MPQQAINPVTGVLTNYPGGPLEMTVNNTKWNGQRITGTTLHGEELVYTMEPIGGFVPDAAGNYVSERPT